MQSRQRYIVVGVLSLMLVVSMVCAHGFKWLWDYFAWYDPALLGIRELPLSVALGYGTGLVGVLTCFFNPRVNLLIGEVADELGRVTWPARKETADSTLSVVVTVLICSAYLGVLDALWLWITNWLLSSA